MPKTARTGKVHETELPSTLQRSDDLAKRTFAKVHDAAAQQYGDEERAHRTAFSALKHSHEKVGDQWEPKEEYGPSDAQAEGGADTNRPTAGGVDANASKQHLYELATRLEVRGRSKMTKAELVPGLAESQRSGVNGSTPGRRLLSRADDPWRRASGFGLRQDQPAFRVRTRGG